MPRLAAAPAVRLAVVLILGLALRLAAASHEHPLVFDERDYADLSTSLAQTGAYMEAGHPTAYRAPGYPAFLALLQRISRRSDPMPARMAQAVLDEASAVLLYLIALPWGATAALLAAAVWSFYPPAILYARLLYPETFFAFLLLLWILFATRLSRDRPWSDAVLGAGAGILALVKTESVFMLVTVPAVLLLRGANTRIVPLFLLGAAVTLGPWIARNTRVMGAPVLVTSGGPVLLIGNHPRATGGYAPGVPDSMLPRGKGEVAESREAYRIAKNYIAAHPLRFVASGVRKAALVFASEAELAVTVFHHAPADRSTSFRQKARELPPWIPIGLTLTYAALLLAGCLGVLAGPHDRVIWLAGAIVVAWVVAHFMTFGGSRYHHVLMPLAALGAGRLAATPRAPRLSASRAAALAVLVVALALILTLEILALVRP